MAISFGTVVIICIILFFIFVLIAVIIAVVINKNDNSNNGPTPVPPSTKSKKNLGTLNSSCKHNGDCGPDYICDNGKCKCKENVKCRTDDDCANDLICTQNDDLGYRICTKPKILEAMLKQSQDITPLSENNKDTFALHTKPHNLRKYQRSIDSDKSRNSSKDSSEISYGSDDELDVRSIVSTEYSEASSIFTEGTVQSVSTPGEETNGAFYCRKDSISQSAPVIDVCGYSNMNIFLLNNGEAICEYKNTLNTARKRIHNNVTLKNIVTFKGYLYGLDDQGKIYTVANPNGTNWIWTKVTFAGTDKCKYMNVTLNHEYLWLQDDKHGNLYSSQDEILYSIDMPKNTYRVYGKDVNSYIDVDKNRNVVKIHPEGTEIKDAFGGVINYHHEVTILKKSEAEMFDRIIIVDWKPYYIRK